MENYTLLKEVPHKEFRAFAQDQINQDGFYQKLYYSTIIISSILFFASLGYSFTLFLLENNIYYVSQMLIGLIISFSLLIIIHELLHGLAYKWMGADQVYYGGSFSSFLFYAACDQEVFSGKQYRFIALFPFLTILIIGVAVVLIDINYFQLILTILFAHTIFCGGDFAVANFMNNNNADKIITYDSKEKELTYFYKEIR